VVAGGRSGHGGDYIAPGESVKCFRNSISTRHLH
jgi:hypothetical protein